MRKIVSDSFLLIVAIVFCLFALFACTGKGAETPTEPSVPPIVDPEPEQPIPEILSAKNVVLMIGDGMGVNHLEVTKAWYGFKELCMEALAVADGFVSTESADSAVTDSAAAATALSAGVKVNNGEVARHDGKDLQTMTEYASLLGKRTGVIATETLAGATPACFSAHASDRGDTDIIVASQLASGIDLFSGAGKTLYDAHADALAQKGYLYTDSLAALSPDCDKKVFACFSSVPPENNTDRKPALKDLALFGMNYLSKASDGNGFFLMIEGSYIDKRSHANDLAATVREVKAFDEAVANVVAWANADKNTAVIVTADHETGKLAYHGETGDELTNRLFESDGHTDRDVKFFLYGRNEKLADYREKKIDNTDIAKLARTLLANDAASRLLSLRQKGLAAG